MIDILIPTGQVDPEGKDILERYRKTFKKKKEADSEHDKMRTMVREKRFLDVKKDYKTTLDELLAKYKENYGDQPSFYSFKNYCLENYKAYFGGDTILASIKYVDVETYRNTLKSKLTRTKTIRTVASVNRETSCLHHVFSKAVEWDMIEKTPFDHGKSLLQKENNQRLRFLSEDEIQRLISECPKHIKPIVQCAIHTGMRRGEILSLKWSQIRNGLIYLQKTKTNESRQIPVNDELVAIFRELRIKDQLRSEYVFLWSHKRIHDFRKTFIAAARRAGIEDIRPHDLRHTFASHLVMKGASLKEVQELLGHKTMTMTLRYAHLSQEHKKKAVNLLSGLTAPGAKSPSEAPMSQNVTKGPFSLSNPL